MNDGYRNSIAFGSCLLMCLCCADCVLICFRRLESISAGRGLSAMASAFDLCDCGAKRFQMCHGKCAKWLDTASAQESAHTFKVHPLNDRERFLELFSSIDGCSMQPLRFPT